jgi:hypothetical protein
MRLAEALVPAFADNRFIADKHCADERIRFNMTPAALGQLQGAAHPDFVGGGGHGQRYELISMPRSSKLQLFQE